MRKGNLHYSLLLWIMGLLFPGTALAFGCSGDGWSWPDVQTKTVEIDASVFTSAYTNKTASITLPPLAGIGATQFSCNGQVNSTYQDAMRVKTINYDAVLGSFTRTLEVSNGASYLSSGTTAVSTNQNISSGNLCLWPDASCSQAFIQSSQFSRNTLGLSIKLTGAPVSIPSGTTLATVVTERRSGIYYDPDFQGENRTIIYKLIGGNVTPPVYTCSITHYDATVTLPSVPRNDLVSNGTGRYSAVTKPVNMTLQCDPNTDVTIHLTATEMSGTGVDGVLKNELSGNDNVGFQLYYNSNPIKINTDVLVITGASGATPLKFDTYYYYNGGAVASGALKAKAEFVMTYK